MKIKEGNVFDVFIIVVGLVALAFASFLILSCSNLCVCEQSTVNNAIGTILTGFIIGSLMACGVRGIVMEKRNMNRIHLNRWWKPMSRFLILFGGIGVFAIFPLSTYWDWLSNDEIFNLVGCLILFGLLIGIMLRVFENIDKETLR